MTVDAYLNPDFTGTEKLIFLMYAFAGIFLCVLVVLGGVRLSAVSLSGKKKKRVIYERSYNRVQRFYEMILSATSVMSFSCAYVIINHIYSLLQNQVGSEEYYRFGTFISLWENGKDFILLLLICLSCVINSMLDRILIPLKYIDKDEKASVRMLGMFYVIFILLYLNLIGDVSEYSPVMLYYLGLMVGRFVYFDASFIDFLNALKNVIRNLYLLLLGLLLTALLCYMGFKRGYLLERNYYLIGVFYTHLFMVVSVFLIHHTHIVSIFVKKPRSSGSVSGEYEKNDDREEYEEQDTDEVYEDDDEYEENDDFEEYEEYDTNDVYEGYEEYEEYEGYDDGYDDPEEYGDDPPSYYET